jgi:trans-aconitate methyltransferase
MTKDRGDDHYNRHLLDLVPPGRRRVVDVGPAHGAFAKALRQRFAGLHITGIDIDLEYARLAARSCDRVFVRDIDTVDEAAFSALFPSDCWVFGDSLEHLRDPWRLLAAVRRRIDSDGCVVTCIPNAQHWSVQARLAAGEFQYEDEGLLDRTHLRWFTRKTMLAMFDQAGWRVEQTVMRALTPPAPVPVLEAVRRLAEAVGADPREAVADCQVFQYVFRLVPRA